jgi:hypothetical protein
MGKKYKKPEIEVSAPLLLRLFEYIKEQPGLTDIDLHNMVESLISLSRKVDDMITMDEYDEIIKKPVSQPSMTVLA